MIKLELTPDSAPGTQKQIMSELQVLYKVSVSVWDTLPGSLGSRLIVLFKGPQLHDIIFKNAHNICIE